MTPRLHDPDGARCRAARTTPWHHVRGRRAGGSFGPGGGLRRVVAR